MRVRSQQTKVSNKAKEGQEQVEGDRERSGAIDHGEGAEGGTGIDGSRSDGDIGVDIGSCATKGKALGT